MKEGRKPSTTANAGILRQKRSQRWWRPGSVLDTFQGPNGRHNGRKRFIAARDSVENKELADLIILRSNGTRPIISLYVVDDRRDEQHNGTR
jgi:hypothetical protein